MTNRLKRVHELKSCKLKSDIEMEGPLVFLKSYEGKVKGGNVNRSGKKSCDNIL